MSVRQNLIELQDDAFSNISYMKLRSTAIALLLQSDETYFALEHVESGISQMSTGYVRQVVAIEQAPDCLLATRL